jgi:hypothetical protein
MTSSYKSLSFLFCVIIHKTVPFLALISFIFETFFEKKLFSGFKTIQGKSGQTKASGPCFNSPVE